MRTVTDDERRARVDVRQGCAEQVAGVEDAARAVVCLHATEPASINLSAFRTIARSGAGHADIDRALYKQRSKVRQLAMRRTVFAFPRDLLPAVWASASAQVASLLASVLGADGAVVRGDNAAGWKVSRPCGTPIERWHPEVTEHPDPAAGYAELVQRWLWSFGPGTEADPVWWLGATEGAVRQALGDAGALGCLLEDGPPAWLHPGDTDEVLPPAAWAALLHALDPTTMGWQGRAVYLGEHTESILTDGATSGPMAWWNGRKSEAGPNEKPSSSAETLPAAPCGCSPAARELTTRFAGDVVNTIYQSPLVRDAGQKRL